jgi:hypothetical protein
MSGGKIGFLRSSLSSSEVLARTPGVSNAIEAMHRLGGKRETHRATLAPGFSMCRQGYAVISEITAFILRYVQASVIAEPFSLWLQ